MKPVEKDEAIAVAKYEIERALLGATEWELWEAGARAATLRPGNIEFSVEWGKLIFVWWDEGRAESWRVAAYLVAGAEIRLQVTRGLGREMRRVALRDPARWAPPATEASLPAHLKPTHRSLFDGSLQGVAHTEKPAFSFQGHPEASPGPHDAAHLFQQFADLMAAHRGA